MAVTLTNPPAPKPVKVPTVSRVVGIRIFNGKDTKAPKVELHVALSLPLTGEGGEPLLNEYGMPKYRDLYEGIIVIKDKDALLPLVGTLWEPLMVEAEKVLTEKMAEEGAIKWNKAYLP